ncbi:MAG: hypothetical protein KC877_04605 [Candidatus Kaiserbacteria bacterium]|nr:hypothetical protein [Candidatus Kaiserbacteria bacterium]MCB9816692.1 hypothetical protein [Candidatus Nomurabacteria bacterium]
MGNPEKNVIDAGDQFPGDSHDDEVQKGGGGRFFYLKEATTFLIPEMGVSSALVPLQVRLKKSISQTGRRNAEDGEARVFICAQRTTPLGTP